MSSKNYFGQAWIIFLLAAGLLLAYPLLYPEVPLLKKHTKTYPGLSYFFQQDTLPPPELDTTGMDSATLAWIDPFYVPPEPQAPPTPDFRFEHSGYGILVPFFRALADTNQQTRIAYYGDSSIEGDLISQTFREAMQQRFGGEGVGFVAPAVKSPGFRRSVNHRFSDDWTYKPVGRSNPWDIPYSIDGRWYALKGEEQGAANPDSTFEKTVAEQKDLPWIRYFRSRRYETTTRFPRLRFFYGPMPSGRANRLYAEVAGETKTFLLKDTSSVNQLLLHQSPCTRVDLRFDVAPRLPIYGLSAESARGVIVDNLALRSNTGIPLMRIPAAQLRAFQELLDYDLIILQFGLNMIDPNRRNFAGYRQQFGKLIRHFQQAMPGVPVLVIGPSDKGTKIGGKMVTDPSIPYITRALQRAAEENGAGFFSFYQAMGGPGSMVRWVEEMSPRLANTDYTHFNFKGGRVASQMLFDFIEEGFNAYRDQKTSADPPNRNSDVDEL